MSVFTDQDRAEMAAELIMFEAERVGYGILTDYRTGTPLRAAAREEWERSSADPIGAFLVETQTETFMAFVDGGPDGITSDDRR
jgi:hypothetical protein